jgi:hypothetical protein
MWDGGVGISSILLIFCLKVKRATNSAVGNGLKSAIRFSGLPNNLASRIQFKSNLRIQSQAILTYVMSCFDFIKKFCEQLRTMICCYWWSNQDKYKLHWLACDILKQPKREGGLGFSDLHAFNNMAMLAKQGWCSFKIQIHSVHKF